MQMQTIKGDLQRRLWYQKVLLCQVNSLYASACDSKGTTLTSAFWRSGVLTWTCLNMRGKSFWIQMYKKGRVETGRKEAIRSDWKGEDGSKDSWENLSVWWKIVHNWLLALLLCTWRAICRLCLSFVLATQLAARDLNSPGSDSSHAGCVKSVLMCVCEAMQVCRVPPTGQLGRVYLLLAELDLFWQTG